VRTTRIPQQQQKKEERRWEVGGGTVEKEVNILTDLHLSCDGLVVTVIVHLSQTRLTRKMCKMEYP